MFLPCSECGEEIDTIEERIELIVDLNRRISLLDELMMAARAKRRLRQERESWPVASSTA